MFTEIFTKFTADDLHHAYTSIYERFDELFNIYNINDYTFKDKFNSLVEILLNMDIHSVVNNKHIQRIATNIVGIQSRMSPEKKKNI